MANVSSYTRYIGHIGHINFYNFLILLLVSYVSYVSYEKGEIDNRAWIGSDEAIRSDVHHRYTCGCRNAWDTGHMGHDVTGY